MAVLDVLGSGFRKVFGSRNERLLKRFQHNVDVAAAFEDELRGDYDERFAADSAKVADDLEEAERANAL